MERWKVIRSIVNFPGSKRGGSLANIDHHLPDVSKVDVWNLNLSLSLELGIDVANEFGAKLHSAFLDAPASDFVDARWIITTYRAAILAPMAFNHLCCGGLTLLKKLLHGYECGNGTTKSWHLRYVMRVVTIAAINDAEVESTKVLEGELQQLTTESAITENILCRALESCPSVLESFRDQMVARLSDEQRLKLLANEEEKALRAFLWQSRVVIDNKRRQFFQRRYLLRVIVAWRKDMRLVRRANRWRQREAFSQWLVTTKRILLSRLFNHISFIHYCVSQRRKSFRKLLKNMRTIKKIRACYPSDEEKNVRAGIGHLRLWLESTRLRESLLIWDSFCVMEHNLEYANNWYDKKLIRRIFVHFRDHATREIRSRKAARRASLQQKMMLNSLKGAGLAHVSRSANAGKRFNDDVLLVKRQKVEQLEEARRRKMKLQEELDAAILAQQHEQRRQRVQNDRQQREGQFELEWSKRKRDIESKCLDHNKSWIRSSDFKNKAAKRQKEVQRLLSITQSSTMDTEREASITSTAVISYAILDGKLASAGIVPDDVFRMLAGKGVINAVPFQSALVSCGLKLKATEFEEIFRGLAQYRKANPDAVDFSDLKVLRQLAGTYVGQEGARWKMYVSEVHQHFTLHDTFTERKVSEKHIKKKHIRQSVRDNLQDIELLNARRKHLEEKMDAHRAMVEYHASLSIQSLYRQWRGRQRIKEMRWILDRRRHLQLRAKQATAVLLIQRKFRMRRSNVDSV